MDAGQTLLEPEDLLRMPDGDGYELIDGVPKERPMGAEADQIAAEIVSLMRPFAKAGKLGRVFGSQTGYRCFPGRPKLVRIPDVSFVADGRFPDGKVPRGHINLVPELVVEVVSPNDYYEEVEQKVAEYRSAGVKLVWVINPGTKTVLVRRLDRTCAEIDEAGTLSGEDVLPGFTCAVAELFV